MATTHLPQTAASPLMLERETELATLEALLAAARDGEGRLVVVEGSAGIGKTRLLAEARRLAELGEFEVLTRAWRRAGGGVRVRDRPAVVRSSCSLRRQTTCAPKC